MNKLKQGIDRAVELFSVALVVVMVLLVLWQVVARYLLNSPSGFSEALTRYLFVWLVLITSTYAFGSRDHMYIAALNDRLKGKVKTVVNILIELLTAVFSGCVMVYGGSIITRMQMVSLDSSLHIPMGVVYAIIPVCGVITVFYCVCNILEELSKAKEAV
ncbi:MAG: TRAP transporter small permease [Faecalibacterium sp.]